MNQGRPSKYGNEMLNKAQHYVSTCWKQKQAPFIEELALELDVDDDTINEWRKEHAEFSATIMKLKTLQRLHLKKGALEKKYQSNMAIFLLKTNHSQEEEQEPVDVKINVVYTDVPEIDRGAK